MKDKIFDDCDINNFFGTNQIPDELPLYYFLLTKKELGDVTHIRFETSELFQGEITTCSFWKPISKIYLTIDEK